MTTGQANEFPIPSDFEGFGLWDKMHCPKVQTPMSQDVFSDGLSAGFTRAMDEFACPIGVTYRPFNYYVYLTTPMQASIEAGSEPFEARLARYGQTIETVVPNIGSLWTNECLPSIMPGLDKTRTQDYKAMNDAELMAAFDESYERFIERYVVHGKINFSLIVASRFADFYNEAFSPEDQTEPYGSASGVPDQIPGRWARLVAAEPDD